MPKLPKQPQQLTLPLSITDVIGVPGVDFVPNSAVQNGIWVYYTIRLDPYARERRRFNTREIATQVADIIGRQPQ